jgi:hypothetical protein
VCETVDEITRATSGMRRVRRGRCGGAVLIEQRLLVTRFSMDQIKSFYALVLVFSAA